VERRCTFAAMNSAQNKQASSALPRYVRPPAKGREYFSSFSRSKLYQLERRGEIRGISLHERPGQKQGIKLFDLQSIFNYIERQAAGADGGAKNKIFQRGAHDA
jgi:hypothetical protein